ncbi:hypothetical protein TKK_0012516 [Trichogramma kaykai]
MIVCARGSVRLQSYSSQTSNVKLTSNYGVLRLEEISNVSDGQIAVLYLTSHTLGIVCRVPRKKEPKLDRSVNEERYIY